MSLILRRRSTVAYKTRTTLAAACLLVAFAGGLTGCGATQGKHTAEFAAQAKSKMSMLKSGTEWQMAQQQFMGGDLPKALKTVDRSIALNPNVPKSHLLRGRILMEMGRLEDARQCFMAAEAIDPKFVEAQYYLGIIHERVNEPKEALACYTKAMDLDTGNAQYLVAAAEMLVQQNQFDQAEQMLADRKQYFQYNAAVRQTMAHIAMLRNQPVEAAQLFNEALLLAPGDLQITEDLIQAQVESRQFADANVNITRILESEKGKDRRDLKQLQARCLVALNRPVEARTILIELTSDKEGGRDVRSWVELGNVAVILKDKINLRQAAARVQAMAPDRADGYYLRALYCRMDNRPEDALIAADKAIAISKVDPTAYKLRALVLEDLGRHSESQQAFAEANTMPTLRQQTEALVGHPEAEVGSPDATH